MASIASPAQAANSCHGRGIDLKRGPLLGAGSLGTLSLATALNEGQLLAIRSVQVEKREATGLGSPRGGPNSTDSHHTCSCLSALCREREGVETMDCPNVFLAYMSVERLSAIAMKVKAQWTKVGEELGALLLAAILQGLESMRSQGLLRCDIKAANILVESEGVKVASLGSAARPSLAASASQSSNTSKLKGTCIHQHQKTLPWDIGTGCLLWMASEVIIGFPTTSGRGVWALGCTATEPSASASKLPRGSWKEQKFVLLKIRQRPPAIPASASALCVDFLVKCFVGDASMRAAVPGLLLASSFVVSPAVSKGLQLREESRGTSRICGAEGSGEQEMSTKPGTPTMGVGGHAGTEERPCSHAKFFSSDAWEFGGVSGGWIGVYTKHCRNAYSSVLL